MGLGLGVVIVVDETVLHAFGVVVSGPDALVVTADVVRMIAVGMAVERIVVANDFAVAAASDLDIVVVVLGVPIDAVLVDVPVEVGVV